MQNLLASPGALVQRHGGEMFRIPTLVPAVKDGACVHFRQGKCEVHENAPFGCAFFDCKSGPESFGLSALALEDVWREWLVTELSSQQASWFQDWTPAALSQARSDWPLYPRLWMMLWRAGKRQLPPEVLKAELIRRAR